MRMWLVYPSTLTLWILLLQVVCSIVSVQAAVQLWISRCDDGMHCLDCCYRMCIVGGNFPGIFEGGWMGDTSEFLGPVLDLFLVFCFLNDYINTIQAWRIGLTVQSVGINHWDVYLAEWDSGSDRTLCMPIMSLAVQYLYPAEVSPNN